MEDNKYEHRGCCQSLLGDDIRKVIEDLKKMGDKEIDKEKLEVVPGKYRHFKGKEYEVLFLAKHSETEETMVVYRKLYDDYSIWVRPAFMWNEIVERDGKKFKRFEKID